VTRETSSDRYLAGALAALVHLLLFAVLVFSLSWTRLPDEPVYADLWRSLPSPHAVVKPEPAPEPKPVEKPVMPPPKPLPPPPKPVNEVKKPDIALKAAKKRAEEQKQEEEEKRQRLLQAMQQAEKERMAQEAKQLQTRLAQERQAAEQQKQAQEKARKNLDQLLSQQMNQELNQESQAIRQDIQSKARSKEMADYVNRIRQKIRGFVRIPPNLQGNPKVVYRVDLLPDGEVVRVTQVSSSGQPAYDQEVERAIWKASPLPLPQDRDAAAAFRNDLELTFRPHEH
jgi:colicin import membrane protein